MQSRWNDAEARALGDDPLQLRVYTSRLLGADSSLVLHGGGNTSVKATIHDLFGEPLEVLYVKGSGWDLATIEAPGFAPVRLDMLRRMAELAHLSDSDMVNHQRAAMTDPTAPTPSVEAILHAIIPYRFVDHTHTDALVTLTNTPHGEDHIKAVYGGRVLIVPYVMPGFILAKTIYTMTRGLDWKGIEGLVLMNHGLFTFADDARTSYENHIRLVTEAEQYLEAQGAFSIVAEHAGHEDLPALARLRKAVSAAAGRPMIALQQADPESRGFAGLPEAARIATRGLLTPDHVIRTKRIPAVVQEDVEGTVTAYADAYRAYYERNAARFPAGSLTMLDPAPRWAVWPGYGTVAFGETARAARIAADVIHHTIRTIQWGESLEEWQPLPEEPIFDVEYWELEQAKLKRAGSPPPFAGKVALVSGAASGIGKACAEAFKAQGAAVVALDLNPAVEALFNGPASAGLVCDVTDSGQLLRAVEAAVRAFGGLDVLVLNAGIFTPTQTLAEMSPDNWEKSLAVNLTAHQRLLAASVPYLRLGFDPAVVVIGSKNVPAPGPGAGAYSVAKAGLTQMVRVAALELAKDGIRVNVLHPDAVFDTAIWTDEVLQKRAASYGMTVEQYKRKNLLGAEISSKDVAALAVALAGPLFGKTTGAQIPVDGGNERVI